jgi:nickel-dependent lactate racemase
MPEWKIRYGHDATFGVNVDAGRLVGAHLAPAPVVDVRGEIAQALARPLDFPAFEQCVFPGDRVVLVLDRATPCAEELIAEVCAVLERRQVAPGDVTILQPGAFQGMTPRDPRRLLTADVSQPVWHVHDPADERSCSYLASTAAGERLYLSRELLDADLVITIGSLGYDPLLGYRGTNSAFYPGLSDAEAIRRSHGQGHDELTPDDPRPLRQLVDEVAWLLGVQYSIQVVPAGDAGVAAVISGQTDSVLQRGKELLSERWKVRLPERPELVIAAVEADAAGHGWEQVGAALELARHVVVRDGRILLLTDLSEEPGDGVRIIAECRSPRDALKPLRDKAPPDLLTATRIAKGIDWANVYLLSRLDPQLVEDLCMIPLENPGEAARLIEGDERCAIIGGAQHTSAEVIA